MRQPIETVPKDGRAVILEDDSTGTYELARWSEHAWVGENGKPCNITAGYWHAMRRAEHLENECQPNNPLQPSAKVANMSGPESERTPAASEILALRPKSNSDTVSVTNSYKPNSPRKAHLSQARRRFAISCGAAMVAASLTCMYFREVVTTHLIEHQGEKSGLPSVSQGAPLPIKQSPKTTLASTPLAEADEASVVVWSEPIANSVTRSPENEQRRGAAGDKLAKPLEEMVSNAGEYSRGGAEAREKETRLKEPLETDITELRRSLQHAQDKILTLENELALLRQHNAQASLSPRQARIRQRRLRNPNPPLFFGAFNSVPYRAPLQRSARQR